MLTVVTTRPPFTYAFTTSLQYISILEKLYFCCLMLKATKFFWCWILKFLFATSVVGATGGSCLETAYVFTSLPTNKARIRQEQRSLEDKDQNRFQSFILFSLALCFSLSCKYRRTCQESFKKRKKQQPQQLQCRSVAAPRAVAAPQHFSTASCSSAAAL